MQHPCKHHSPPSVQVSYVAIESKRQKFSISSKIDHKQFYMVLIEEVYLSYGSFFDFNHTAPIIVTRREIKQYNFSEGGLYISKLTILPQNLVKINIPQFEFDTHTLEKELKLRYTNYGLNNCRQLTAFVIARLVSNCDINTKDSVHDIVFKFLSNQVNKTLGKLFAADVSGVFLAFTFTVAPQVAFTIGGSYIASMGYQKTFESDWKKGLKKD